MYSLCKSELKTNKNVPHLKLSYFGQNLPALHHIGWLCVKVRHFTLRCPRLCTSGLRITFRITYLYLLHWWPFLFLLPHKNCSAINYNYVTHFLEQKILLFCRVCKSSDLITTDIVLIEQGHCTVRSCTMIVCYDLVHDLVLSCAMSQLFNFTLYVYCIF